ncbi:MAG: hypothetical protein Q9165_007561 [Trypethelium subeluteriae]
MGKGVDVVDQNLELGQSKQPTELGACTAPGRGETCAYYSGQVGGDVSNVELHNDVGETAIEHPHPTSPQILLPKEDVDLEISGHPKSPHHSFFGQPDRLPSQVLNEHVNIGPNLAEKRNEFAAELQIELGVGHELTNDDTNGENASCLSVGPDISQEGILPREHAVRSDNSQDSGVGQVRPKGDHLMSTEGEEVLMPRKAIPQAPPPLSEKIVSDHIHQDVSHEVPGVPVNDVAVDDDVVHENAAEETSETALHVPGNNAAKDQNKGSVVCGEILAEEAVSQSHSSAHSTVQFPEQEYFQTKVAEAASNETNRGSPVVTKELDKCAAEGTDTAVSPARIEYTSTNRALDECVERQGDDFTGENECIQPANTPKDALTKFASTEEEQLSEDDGAIKEKPLSYVFVDEGNSVPSSGVSTINQQSDLGGSKSPSNIVTNEKLGDTTLSLGEDQERESEEYDSFQNASPGNRDRQSMPNLRKPNFSSATSSQRERHSLPPTYNYLEGRVTDPRGSERPSYVYFSNMLRFSRTGFAGYSSL